MRRADRLFRIVQLLRTHKVITAERLAEELEVSKRTVYRDMGDLGASGIPLLSEAGVGYSLARGFELPPLMFDVEEIEALVLGARMVESWGDEALRAAARRVIEKVELVVPPPHKERLRGTALFAVNWTVSPDLTEHLPALRQATSELRKVWVRYRDAQGRSSERMLRPLGLYFWGSRWTLAAWCELRGGFRNFRVDRFDAVEVSPEAFALEPPCTLEAFLASIDEADRLRAEAVKAAAGADPAANPTAGETTG